MWEEQIDRVSQYNKVDILRKKNYGDQNLISNLTWKNYSKKISLTSHLSKSELRKKIHHNLKISR